LLVTRLLAHWKALTKPLLYLSLFFKRHRDDYYRRSSAVRVDGDWEGAAVRLFELLRRHPLVSTASAMKLLETSKPTAARAIDTLARAGVLIEITGKKRDRWYSCQAYLEHLRVGTDLDMQGRSPR
jgi:Fic family protein